MKRATVYFDAALHRALRLKAAATERSISDLVNDAVRGSLTEDADDLAAIEDRSREGARPFEDFVGELRGRTDAEDDAGSRRIDDESHGTTSMLRRPP